MGTLVQWLKLLAWEVGDRGLEPHSGLQVSKKQIVSPPLSLYVHKSGLKPHLFSLPQQTDCVFNSTQIYVCDVGQSNQHRYDFQYLVKSFDQPIDC